MDSDSDFGFGGIDDDDASFTPSVEEEQQQQDENIVNNPSAIDNDSDFGFGGNGEKCMEAWRLQLVSRSQQQQYRSQQQQYIKTLYINACATFLLHLRCSHLLLLVQEKSRMFHVFCVFSWATMVDKEVEVER